MVFQTTDPNETVHARADGAGLIEYDDEHDRDGGAVLLERHSWRPEFESFADARLFFGLWVRCGPYIVPESDGHVPLDVAAEGRAALASYLLVGRGERRSTEWVASKLGLSSTQSVRNYTNKIRWTPEEDGVEA